MAEGKIGVLLLHGLTGVPSELRPVEKYLRNLGFDLEIPLLAGHGGTHHDLMAVGWQDWIASARDALNRLLERCDQAVICGLSLGSTIGAILAAENPKVIGLAMMSPTLDYDGSNLDNLAHQRKYKSKFLRRLLQVVLWPFPFIRKQLYWTETPPYGLRDQRLQRQITKSIEAAQRGENTEFGLFRTYFESFHQMYLLSDHFSSMGKNVSCPVLMISSLEDTLVTLRNPTGTYALMAGSKNKSLVLLTGCDHVIALDLKRNYVCRLIGEFMEALTGVKATSTETKSELTIEIGTRLNPLSNTDWQELTPEQAPIMDTVKMLQSYGIHEQDCHTMVVRYNNEPVLMLPMFAAEAQLQPDDSPFAKCLHGLLAVLAPALLRTKVMAMPFPETHWGNESGAPARWLAIEEGVRRQFWQFAHDTIDVLAPSLKCPLVVFKSESGEAASSRVFPPRSFFWRLLSSASKITIGSAAARSPAAQLAPSDS
jgi:carboxylesterase